MISFLIKDNENVSKFLKGDDSYIPVSELQYLHIHPLLRPNFLTEIEDLVREVGEKIIQKRITGKPVEQLEVLAIEIGLKASNPLITNEDGKAMMISLRKLYKLCNSLKEKL